MYIYLIYDWDIKIYTKVKYIRFEWKDEDENERKLCVNKAEVGAGANRLRLYEVADDGEVLLFFLRLICFLLLPHNLK